jgi:hypothetical protein
MTQRIPTGYTSCSIQLKHLLLARPAFVTLGLDTSAVDMADSGIRDGIGAALRAFFSPELDESVTVGPVTFRVGPYPPEAVIYVDPDTVAGAESRQSPPPATALLVNLQTSRGGRRGRGRIFIPWAVDRTDISEGGIVGSTSLTAWQTQLTAGLAALAAADVPLVVLHTFNEAASESPDIGGAPNAVLSATPQSLISTQRRRLGR